MLLCLISISGVKASATGLFNIGVNSLVFCYNTCLYVKLVIGCITMHVLTFYVPLLL